MTSMLLNINYDLVGWISLLLLVPAMAIARPSNALANLLRNTAEMQRTDTMRTDTTKIVTIKRLTPVFYLKDKSPDSGSELSNLTMGIAKKGERVSIIKQRQGMLKVEFKATGKIGWVSQRAL